MFSYCTLSENYAYFMKMRVNNLYSTVYFSCAPFTSLPKTPQQTTHLRDFSEVEDTRASNEATWLVQRPHGNFCPAQWAQVDKMIVPSCSSLPVTSHLPFLFSLSFTAQCQELLSQRAISWDEVANGHVPNKKQTNTKSQTMAKNEVHAWVTWVTDIF